jgi:hypothetical protein
MGNWATRPVQVGISNFVMSSHGAHIGAACRVPGDQFDAGFRGSLDGGTSPLRRM